MDLAVVFATYAAIKIDNDWLIVYGQEDDAVHWWRDEEVCSVSEAVHRLRQEFWSRDGFD